MAINLYKQLFVLIVCFISHATGESVSACFGSANRSLDINCGPGYMIHVTRRFYGYSPSGACHQDVEENGGCTLDERVKNEDCVAKSSCSVNMGTGTGGPAIQGCSRLSNYFQVEYKCVEVSKIHSICDEKLLTEQSGYIMTPNYPAKFTQSKCVTSILAHAQQKITLQIIKLNLQEQESNDCKDHLYFNDKFRSITLCGSRTNNTYKMHSNSLHVELMSRSHGESQGFLLFYQALPRLPNSLQPPTATENSLGDDLDKADEKQNEEMQEETTEAYHPKSTVPMIRNNNMKHKKSLPFAAIAGGVIGTLSLVLIVLLLMLFVKWFKERRYYKAEKVLEIRNPAFRSSNDFHDSQTQHCNNLKIGKSSQYYSVC